jgi:hypothetical protein
MIATAATPAETRRRMDAILSTAPGADAARAAYPDSMLHDRRRRAGIAATALAVLVAVSTCGGAYATGTTTPLQPDARLPASDRFSGRSLHRSWSILQPDLVETSVRRGALTLTLTSPALWFNDSMGVLVYKPVTGDFKATATVHTRSASSPGQPPAPTIRLGGLMARDPASDDTRVQSYVHIVAGNGPSGVLAIENKTTMNSNSVYEAPEWPSPDAQLRICRVGSTFNVYKRPVRSKTWQLAASYDRPDLPPTLQVGADVYSPNAPPDLRVGVDAVTFKGVASNRGCTEG